MQKTVILAGEKESIDKLQDSLYNIVVCFRYWLFQCADLSCRQGVYMLPSGRRQGLTLVWAGKSTKPISNPMGYWKREENDQAKKVRK